MACGTGKTLVALWVAEQVAQASSPASSADLQSAVSRICNPRAVASSTVIGDAAGCRLQIGDTAECNSAPRILILLPSLALLRQTLHEWLRETLLPSLAYLCVCSDPTVKEGIDALATPQSDLDFQVSTDAASVRRFLDAPFAGVKMIFSTYQSASVVGAAMPPGEAFDFAVFDEAHKTAGREGRNFGFALEDKNISIRKRLFLTATPRHYNPHDRDREGEARLLFSMDNPAVYGPQAYRLTFAEAARRCSRSRAWQSRR
jgi:predicted helicase